MEERHFDHSVMINPTSSSLSPPSKRGRVREELPEPVKVSSSSPPRETRTRPRHSPIRYPDAEDARHRINQKKLRSYHRKRSYSPDRRHHYEADNQDRRRPRQSYSPPRTRELEEQVSSSLAPRPPRVKGHRTGCWLKGEHSLVFQPKEGPLFVGNEVSEVALQMLFVEVRVRAQRLITTKRVSCFPVSTMVVVGAGQSAFNSTLKRFKEEFGKDAVVGLPDRTDDTWNSLRVRKKCKDKRTTVLEFHKLLFLFQIRHPEMLDRKKEGHQKRILLTNGFIPVRNREVRFVIGLGVPWVGYDGCSRLMNQWLKYLDEVGL